MRTDSLQQYVKLHRQLAEERSRLQARIQQIDNVLGTIPPVSLSVPQGAATSSQNTAGRAAKRQITAEGRARIAAAQKARWAKQKGGNGTTAKAANVDESSKPKRKMSAAGRKAIAEAARKRWAAARAAGKSKL